MDSPSTFVPVAVRRSARRVSLSDFSPKALAWLAMAPTWPVRVVRNGFPVGPKDWDAGDRVVDSLEKMAAGGLVESGHESYSMNRGQSAIAIAWLTGSAEDSKEGESPRWTRPRLLEELTLAGRQMQAGLSKPDEGTPARTMESQILSSSGAIARWAELAVAGGLGEMANLLSGRADAAFETARKNKQVSCPEVARWLETAHPLAALFQGALEAVVTRIERQLDLFHRDSRDEKVLENYFVRSGPEDALRAMLDGPDDLWALHYLGVGGMGKTMLLRHIQARLAPTLGIATARIDFDRLNPDYPLRAPGLLLMGIAQELQLRASDEVASRLMSFRLYMEQIHRSLEGSAASGLSAEMGIQAAGFQDALELFIQPLQLMGRSSRPVLILDTCEELARMRPDGVLPRAVEATFEVLELLHSRVPGMRIVFSGRRPLARAGYEWTAEGSNLPQRPYLRVFYIRGFDETEGRSFLGDYKRGGKQVSPVLIGTILSRSVSAQSQSFQQIRIANGSTESEIKRYNPYDLDLFAAWATAAEPLTEEKLRTASVHLYVKERITGRIAPILEPWLADLAVLGRFDRALIQRLTGLAGDESSAVWEEIRDQEWTDSDRQAIKSTEVLMIDPNLLVRLRDYFADEQKAVFSRARQRVRDVLREATLQRPFSNLTPSYFGVTLGVLEPADAASWLEQVTKKVAGEDRWDWVPALVDALEDELERQSGELYLHKLLAWPNRPPSPLDAGVAALGAAAKLRYRPSELEAAWKQVLDNADLYPDAGQAAVLKYRAGAGLIAHLRWTTEAPAGNQPEDFHELLYLVPSIDQLIQEPEQFSTEMALLEDCAEIVSAADELAKSLEGLLVSRFQAALDWITRHDHPPLWEHFLIVQKARAEAAWGRVPADKDYLDFANRDLAQNSTGGPAFPDWRRPPDLALRIQLEWMRLLRWRYDYQPSDPRSEVVRLDLPGIEDVRLRLDADRLASLYLQKASDLACPDEWTPWERIVDTVAVERKATPDCYANRVIAPYFTVEAELRAASGGVQDAIGFLQRTGGDSTLREDTIRWSERSLWRIIQRMRLLEVMPELQTLLERSPIAGDRRLVAGAKAFQPGIPGKFAGRSAGIPTASDFEKLLAQLDKLETSNDQKKLAEVRNDAGRWIQWNPLYGDGQVILLTRLRALEPGSMEVVAWDNAPGPRRLAEILLEEGALTALRNSDAGTKMLEAAASAYGSVQDRCGLFLAEMNLLCLHWKDKVRLARAVAALQDFRGWRNAPALPDWNSSGGWEPKWMAITAADRMWQPWLIRLLAVETWQSSPRRASAPATEFAAKLREFYRNGFPPDFPLPKWFTPEAPGTSQLGIEGFLSLTVGIGVLFGLFLLFKWGIGKFYPDLGWGNSFLAFCLFFGVLGSIPIFFQKGRELVRWLLNAYFVLVITSIRNRAVITLTTTSDPVKAAAIDPRHPWTSEYKVQLVSVLFKRLSLKTAPALKFAPTDASDYMSQSIHFGGVLQSDGRRKPAELSPFMRRTIKGAAFRTDLEVPPEGAGMCWEAIIGLVGGAVSRVSDLGFCFRRIAPGDGSAPPRFADRFGVRYFGRTINPWSGILPDSYSGWRPDSAEEADPACVILHLRGDIIEADGVLRFLEWAGTGSKDSTAAPPIKLETFLRSYPMLKLAVLEPPPLVERERLQRDRDRACIFRRAADYLSRNHVAAAVTLPPLPDALADEAIRELGRKVEHGGDLVEPLRDAVRSIQLWIDNDKSLEDQTTLELAYDVCYYAASRVSIP